MRLETVQSADEAQWQRTEACPSVCHGLDHLDGSLAVLLVYLLGRAWFGHREGLLAAWLCALYPNLIAYSHYLWSEPLFIVLVLFLNPLFDTKLCEDTFTITPTVFEVGDDTWPAADWNVAEGGFPAPIWPSAEELPPAVAIFRRPYESTKYALITLFLGRFLCCNVANSRWRAMSDNITRASHTAML